MTNTTATAIDICGVHRVFGSGAKQVTALHDINLKIAAGEFVSLIGPSGCGKSTLLRLIADLDQPTDGEITVFGHSPSEARRAREYGIAFQQAGLLPWRSVRENVDLPLRLAGRGKHARRERIDHLLDMVGLTSFADHYPDQLSGGMQQRVAIARALAEEPSLLLMDEPFGALDEMTREHLQTQLLRISAESRAAVVFVTHSIPEAVFLSNRVVVMSPRPGEIRRIVDIDLDRSAVTPQSASPLSERSKNAEPEHDTVDLRTDARFFEAVAQVRDALHDGVPTGAGVDLR
ncbi:ABC transporter ATP-binding protein [Populibacterium corticicola]|uniref:ABC transporter ATP-binding protein n=1 Tax=Populibacterium corticicola TaxID=1812826 RepID=A0ABW5XAI5_9MICO